MGGVPFCIHFASQYVTSPSEVACLLGGWLACWLACLIAGLLACWRADLLHCWLACLLPCLLAGLLACLLAGLLTALLLTYDRRPKTKVRCPMTEAPTPKTKIFRRSRPSWRSFTSPQINRPGRNHAHMFENVLDCVSAMIL